MIAAWAPPNVIHQMAPVDGPKAVEAFLQHWQPDAAVFAEGEIWPNMLGALKAHGVPAALVNARMTEKTLKSWKWRKASAAEVFGTFGFIGAADQADRRWHRSRDGPARSSVVGNLKTGHRRRSAALPRRLPTFRDATGGRPIVLAASTHPGEDEFALDAFTEVRMRKPGALMIVVPRHPDRGDALLR
jgi:3-deoxy-D-manno-octulosonic-acid transferase